MMTVNAVNSQLEALTSPKNTLGAIYIIFGICNASMIISSHLSNILCDRSYHTFLGDIAPVMGLPHNSPADGDVELTNHFSLNFLRRVKPNGHCDQSLARINP